MIGLDTNVLVRYLVQDDPEQAEQAKRVIEQAAAENIPIFINQIVICELLWVLSYSYDYSKDALIDLLQKMLSIKQFEIEEREIVWTAFGIYKKSKADFADCLLGIKNHRAGCSTTMTFDKAALSLDVFESPQDGVWGSFIP